jgi:CW_7 repeat
MIRRFGNRKGRKMSTTPPTPPRIPQNPPQNPPTRPKVPVENKPTTIAGSGDNKAPDNAPQSASANEPSTVNAESKDDLEELPQSDGEEGEKTLTDVAMDAANGVYGSGQERRRNLKAAGWDFREVEAEIVRLRNQ